MTVTRLLAAAFFALMPMASFATCSGHEQANACAEGFTWDAETNSCVEVVAS
ncbi:MAG: adenylosuccinate lyase [Maritimibacter sp.]|nr:adenylosuccinate lyase [Maritimibacter sp.]